MIRLAILPLVLGIGLVATSAQAGSALVRVDDLDLASEAGKASLDKRIEQAASRMCRDQMRTGTRIPARTDSSEMRACRDAVRDEVMSQLPDYR